MAALAAQGPSGQDDNPAQRPDVPRGDPLPGEMAGWRLGDPVEYWEPVITRPDPLSEAEWLAWCEATAGQDEPFDPEEWFDPGGPPAPGEDVLTAAELAGIAEAVEGVTAGARLGTTGALAVLAASAGRRGPGQPGRRGYSPASRPAGPRRSAPAWRWT